ncbi:MAG TPA: GNAT family N-acetyltransferase [Burkholderiales bacterium]|nr:GNAT family N-acetyltransferase [Burkholderiales bacterium]
MAIRFDAAAAKDLPQMVELLGTLFAQEAEFTPDAAKQEAAVKMILADPKLGRFYVAKDGARVVAMACLLFTVSTAEGGKAALFEDLVVRDDYRRQGIGARLLEHVIAQARAEGVLRLTLLTDMQNEQAQSLYRRLGFVGSPMKPMRLKLKPK